MRLAAALTVALIAGTACGTGDSGSKAAPPSGSAAASAAAGTSGENSTPSAAAGTQRDRSWAAVDPCTLLEPAQLTAFLAKTPVKPARADADGKHVCAWGDGEFRSVRLSVWQPASAAELAKGAVRQVPVGDRTAQVVRDADYTCEMQAGDVNLAVNLQTVSMDKLKLCPDTTTALAAVVAKLPR